MNQIKICYASAPYRADEQHTIEQHVELVMRMVEERSHNNPHILYLVPHMMFPHAKETGDPVLDGEIAQRVLEMQCQLIASGKIDEVHVFGDRVSTGMKLEIQTAHLFNIPVWYMNKNPSQAPQPFSPFET